MKFTESDMLKDLKERSKLSKRELSPMLDQMETDFNYYLSEQITGDQKDELVSKGRPPIAINITKKPVDVIVGFQMQNRSDVRAFPVQSRDQRGAEIMSQLMKWAMANGGGYHFISQAFFNAAIGGLGWVETFLKYDKDIINGDFQLGSVSPFRILYDPFVEMPDFSDAEYMIRLAFRTKRDAQRLYPDAAKDIKQMQGERPSEDFDKFMPHAYNDEEYVFLNEYWYKDTESKRVLYDPETDRSRVISDEVEDSKIKELKQMVPSLKVIKKKVETMKCAVVVGNEVVVYNDKSPYETNDYPFTPVLCTFRPEVDKWDRKTQGLIRPIRDLQDEKNKRTQQIMATVLQMPFSGWMYKDGTIEDESVFSRQTGAGQMIKWTGEKPEQIRPPEFPMALAQLDQSHEAAARTIGINAEMQGLSPGGDQNGIVISLRQRQGQLSTQFLYENLSFSQRALGVKMIEMFRKNYTTDKVREITDIELPEGYTIEEDVTRYDCMVDEIANSPTFRMMAYMQLMELADKGYPIPPKVLLEFSDIPMSAKEALIAEIDKAEQAEQAQQAPPQAPPGGMPQGMSQGAPPQIPPEVLAQLQAGGLSPSMIQ